MPSPPNTDSSDDEIVSSLPPSFPKFSNSIQSQTALPRRVPKPKLVFDPNESSSSTSSKAVVKPRGGGMKEDQRRITTKHPNQWTKRLAVPSLNSAAVATSDSDKKKKKKSSFSASTTSAPPLSSSTRSISNSASKYKKVHVRLSSSLLLQNFDTFTSSSSSSEDDGDEDEGKPSKNVILHPLLISRSNLGGYTLAPNSPPLVTPRTPRSSSSSSSTPQTQTQTQAQQHLPKPIPKHLCCLSCQSTRSTILLKPCNHIPLCPSCALRIKVKLTGRVDGRGSYEGMFCPICMTDVKQAYVVEFDDGDAAGSGGGGGINENDGGVMPITPGFQRRNDPPITGLPFPNNNTRHSQSQNQNQPIVHHNVNVPPITGFPFSYNANTRQNQILPILNSPFSYTNPQSQSQIPRSMFTSPHSIDVNASLPSFVNEGVRYYPSSSSSSSTSALPLSYPQLQQVGMSGLNEINEITHNRSYPSSSSSASSSSYPVPQLQGISGLGFHGDEVDAQVLLRTKGRRESEGDMDVDDNSCGTGGKSEKGLDHHDDEN